MENILANSHYEKDVNGCRSIACFKVTRLLGAISSCCGFAVLHARQRANARQRSDAMKACLCVLVERHAFSCDVNLVAGGVKVLECRFPLLNGTPKDQATV